LSVICICKEPKGLVVVGLAVFHTGALEITTINTRSKGKLRSRKRIHGTAGE